MKQNNPEPGADRAAPRALRGRRVPLPVSPALPARDVRDSSARAPWRVQDVEGESEGPRAIPDAPPRSHPGLRPSWLWKVLSLHRPKRLEKKKKRPKIDMWLGFFQGRLLCKNLHMFRFIVLLARKGNLNLWNYCSFT